MRGKFVQRQLRLQPWPFFCVKQTLTRDLVVVANHLVSGMIYGVSCTDLIFNALESAVPCAPSGRRRLMTWRAESERGGCVEMARGRSKQLLRRISTPMMDKRCRCSRMASQVTINNWVNSSGAGRRGVLIGDPEWRPPPQTEDH